MLKEWGVQGSGDKLGLLPDYVRAREAFRTLSTAVLGAACVGGGGEVGAPLKLNPHNGHIARLAAFDNILAASVCRVVHSAENLTRKFAVSLIQKQKH